MKNPEYRDADDALDDEFALAATLIEAAGGSAQFFEPGFRAKTDV